MKNKGIKIGAMLLALILIVFIGINFTIGSFIKSSIEETGTELFQTEVTVGSVSISMFDGSGEIHNLSVANPDEFSDQAAIEMSRIQIELDLGSLLSDTVVVERVYIRDASMFFEQEGFGINLRTLNENMEQSEDTDEAPMVINSLIVENATVRVSTTVDRERTAEASIENFELNEIGKTDSNTLKQTMRQIMEPLMNRAIQEAISGGLLDQLKNRVQELFDGDGD